MSEALAPRYAEAGALTCQPCPQIDAGGPKHLTMDDGSGHNDSAAERKVRTTRESRRSVCCLQVLAGPGEVPEMFGLQS